MNAPWTSGAKRGVVIAVALLILVGVTVFVGEKLTGSGLSARSEYLHHTSAVYSLSRDSNGLVASGGEDGLHVWRLENVQTTLVRRPGRVQSVAFLPHGRLLCADANEGLLILNAKSGQILNKLGAPAVRVVAAASWDGQWIAASFSRLPDHDGDRPTARDIVLWSMETDPPSESVLGGHQGPVFALAFHPYLPHLISRSEDGTIRAWDLTTKQSIATQGTSLDRPWRKIAEARGSCAFDPQGKHLLTGNLVSPYPELEPSESLLPVEPAVHAGVFSPDGKWIATGDALGRVRLWNVQDRTQVAEFSAFKNRTPVFALIFSADSRFLVTAGEGMLPGFDALAQHRKPDDTTIRIWEVAALLSP